MIESQTLLGIFTKELKTLKFKKKRTTWHRVFDDVIQVVMLQKSQYGPSYYLNISFYLRALGDNLSPPENHCHLRARVNNAFSEEGYQVRVALELEYAKLPEAAAIEILETFLRGTLANFFTAHQDLASIRRSYLAGKLDGFDPIAKVRHLLEKPVS